MDKILAELNAEQVAAVTHQRGPLLIIAGAGTGKTTVITRRIAWLIREGLAKQQEILALTFTDKAAREMQERVDILMPYGYTDIWISTFHAFGDKLLRENALICGIDLDFKVLTRPEAAVLLREHIFEFNLNYYRPLSDPTRFIDALIALFSRARDEDVSPEDYLRYSQQLLIQAKKTPDDKAKEEETLQQREVANAYAKYHELLSAQGMVDFAHQFYLALNLLREHPLVLKNYQEHFKYILVDEFQDTNVAQLEIVKLLAAKEQNITVVADDDQSIYRWRGAAYSNVLNFINAFPEAEKISLIQNYRSTQVILDSAYRLIQQNNPERFEVKAKINKRLIGLISVGKPVTHLHFDNNSTEADNLAKIIKDKVLSGGFKYRDFAILVRSNSDANPFLQALNMQDIPWQFSGNQGLYTREEVRLCINFLRVVANLSDSLSLFYLVSSEIYNLTLAELSLCSHYARRRNRPLYLIFKEIETIEELKEISQEFREKVKVILADLMKFLKLSRVQTTGRLLYSFLNETGYLKQLTKNPSLENETKIQNLAKFFNLVQDFARVAKEDRVFSFVNYLNLLIEAGDDPSTVEAEPDSDAVNVLTIHKAKGLEFRVVFLVSLVNGRFPWPRRSQPIELPDALIKEVLPEGDYHLQEERRLFYVGMTRAKEELYFTSAEDYGGSRLRRVSQFVLEALGKEIEAREKKKATALEAITRFSLPRGSLRQETEKVSEDKLLNLSYYHLDDYLTCPLKYKYVNILRVPIMEHHTVIYGRAMHEAVSRYFQKKLLAGKMDKDELLETFKINFDPQGFLDAKHQQERFRTGQEALLRFFGEEERRHSHPKFIEKEFSFILENNKINGRFDRVDQEADGVVIMDFKTSEIHTQKDADKRTRESLQLKLYSLAYKIIFGCFPKEVKLYFLESGIIGISKVREDIAQEVREKIKRVSSGIRRQEFPATPTYLACVYCAYNQICPKATIE